MSNTRRVVAMPPIEAISGKFALERETISSEKPRQSKRYFGARIKASSTRNLFYYRKNPNPEVTSSTERETFAFVAKWKIYTLGTASLRISALADFKNNKTLQGKKPRDYSFTGWVFAVRYAQKKADPDIEVSDTTYVAWPTA